MSKLIPLALTLLAAATAGGCGTGSGTLSGKVTLKNVPVASGFVTAIGSNGVVRTGEIKPDGTYEIKNCPGGKVTLSVSSPDPSGAAEINKRLSDSARGGAKNPSVLDANKKVTDNSKWFPIPEQYAFPDTSGLSTEVNGNTTYNIELP